MKELIEAPAVPANIAEIASVEGLKPYLDHAKDIAAKSAKEVNDAKTDKGRKAIGSLARKVASSKTAITTPGAELVKSLKQQGVDAQKLFKSFSDDMDKISSAIKLPVTEWNQAEKARIDGLHSRIDAIGDLSTRACPETGTVYTAEELTEKREIVGAMTFDDEEFGGLHEQAMDTWNQALEFLDSAIKDRTEYERALEKSTALKAVLAENEAKQRIKDAEVEATRKAEQAAAGKVAQAELDVKNAEQAARDKLAEEQAEKDRDQAEKNRRELARAADTNHRKAINNRAVNELMQCAEGLTDEQAKLIVKHMASKNFTDITINY